MYLALDEETNDLILKDGGGVERVDDGRFVIQQVRSKLRTILGEWPLDRSIGWVNINDFVKNYDIFDIESRARDIIVETQGVNAVNFLSTTNVGRAFTLHFEATTIYGNIDLSIPWGV